jgi:hypothetical protein
MPDDLLGSLVTGRCLAGENDGARHAALAPAVAFQLLIQRHHVKHVEKLPLVFVDALSLYVEEGRLVGSEAELLAKLAGEPSLVSLGAGLR